MNFKKYLSVILIVGLLMFLFSGISLAVTYINFGTGSPGGTYYPLGGAMADLWTKLLKAEGISVTAESTAAPVENSRLVGSGERFRLEWLWMTLLLKPIKV